MSNKLDMTFLSEEIPGMTLTDAPNFEIGVNSNKNKQSDANKAEHEREKPIAIAKITYEDILADSDNILSIDPSQNSSGFAIYSKDFGLKLIQSKLVFDSKSVDPLRYYNLQQQFKADLMEFLHICYGDTLPEFDSVVIEDTVFDHSAQTFKKLVLINASIDSLVAEGYIKTNDFIRMNNQIWKRELRQFKIGKKHKNDKLDAEESLKILKVPLAVEYSDQPDTWKKKTGYQDKLDAVGMLLASVLSKSDAKIVTKKKVKQKLIYKVVSKEYLEEHKADFKAYTDLYVERPDLHIAEVVSALRQQDTKVKHIIKFKSLGSWGIQNDLLGFSPDENYLIVTGG